MMDASAINIRQATSQDIAKILPLLAQFFEENGFDVAFQHLPTAIAAQLNKTILVE